MTVSRRIHEDISYAHAQFTSLLQAAAAQLTSLRLRLHWTALHYEIAHHNLHGLAVLIRRRHPQLHPAVLWARPRWPYLEHFGFDVKFVARPNRTRQPKFVEPGVD